MKASTFILALFFLGLTSIPCADAEIDKDGIETVSENGLDHQHDSDNDLCSPFCVCHCCHTHIVTDHNFYSDLMNLPTVIQKTGYADFITKGFKASLLQPPKLKISSLQG